MPERERLTEDDMRPKKPPRDVYLRNDSPGVRIVHDSEHNVVEIQPGQAVKVNLPATVADMFERDAQIQVRRGNQRFLRSVNRRAFEESQEGRGPPPVSEPLTGEREAAADLANRAEDMDWREFQDSAREVLGEQYPQGRPSKSELVDALNRKARGQ